MAHKDFWKKFSGNFPLEIAYKEGEDFSGTPEGVEVRRADQSVFLTRDDVLIALGLFDDSEESAIQKNFDREKLIAEATEAILMAWKMRARSFDGRGLAESAAVAVFEKVHAPECEMCRWENGFSAHKPLTHTCEKSLSTDDEREALVEVYLEEHGHHADARHGFLAGLVAGPSKEEK